MLITLIQHFDKMYKSLTILISAAMALLFSSCASIPKGAVAVKPFDTQRYMGKWYEVARMDFRFERNLKNVTATYSIKENGRIRVENRGFNYVTNEWKTAIGKAKPAGKPDEAMLKVSFFGPFYAGYNVIALDADYQYALVAGQNTDYLWILSRQKTIPADVKQTYLKQAEALGFKTDALIWTVQD